MDKLTFVTIVGSRKATDLACKFMAEQSVNLRRNGIVVRTGNAPAGVDHAVCHPTLYSDSFNVSELEFIASKANLEVYSAKDAEDDPAAMRMAAKYHGAWDKVATYAKLLHARNCYQVAGLMLTAPSEFILCWTPDGAQTHRQRNVRTGGTGTAISIGSAEYDIPVYNTHKPGSINSYYRHARTLLA